jgi:hypothetical protein
MEEKKRKPGGGRKKLPPKEKRVQLQISVKQKNKLKVNKAITQIIKELDV